MRVRAFAYSEYEENQQKWQGKQIGMGNKKDAKSTIFKKILPAVDWYPSSRATRPRQTGVYCLLESTSICTADHVL